MGEKLTKSDVAKIEKEIRYRKLEVRPEAIDAVRVARAQGDLSENFEYYAAKKEKNHNESRISYLEHILKTAEIIDDSSADGEVGINKKVKIEYIDDKEMESYKIVTPIRSNSMENRISIESPLGKALMGHKAGDKIFVQLDGDDGYYIKVISVEIDDSDEEINSF